MLHGTLLIGMATPHCEKRADGRREPGFGPERFEGDSTDQEPVTTLYSAGPKRFAIGIAAAALVIAISAAVIAGVAFFSSSDAELSALLSQASETSAPSVVVNAGETRVSDATTPPDNIPALIDQVSESVVWLECPAGGGTGWVIVTAAEPNTRPAFKDAYEAEAMVLVVTAEHVVRSCVKKRKNLMFMWGSALLGRHY